LARVHQGIEIDVTAAILRQASVEDGGGLPASFANFVRFECVFHDLGHGSALTAREAMREIARLGTPHG
jgi:hypothetical protein